MKRRDTPELVEDLAGGEIVRLDAGLVRITHRMPDPDRWAILLNDDLSETRKTLWLDPKTRVLELVREARSKAEASEEVDPLLSRVP